MAYFCLPDTDEHRPDDGLYDASCVIKAIQAFCIGTKNPFEGFDTTDSSALHGLNVVFDCVTHAIDTARRELADERRAEHEREREQRFTAADLDDARRQERARTLAQFETIKTELSEIDASENPATPIPPEALSAREVAIMEALRKGFGVEDIAQAVNLKKASVQRIIAKLRTTGDLPRDNDKVDRAASA